MMSKEQEALHNLRQFVELFNEGYPKNVEDFKLNECVKSFGELVEKATPKKVEEPYKQHDKTLIGECPHCTAFVQSRNYCGHCGQKLDWSEDDE